MAEFVGVNPSTLRFWEKEFPEINPMRTASGIRYYTPQDIETLKIIYFLVKIKGMKLDSAKAHIAANRKNISTRLSILENLVSVRDELQTMLDSLSKIYRK